MNFNNLISKCKSRQAFSEAMVALAPIILPDAFVPDIKKLLPAASTPLVFMKSRRDLRIVFFRLTSIIFGSKFLLNVIVD